MAITKERHMYYYKDFRYEYVSRSDMKEILHELNNRFDIDYDFYANGFVFVKSKDKIWLCREELLRNDFSGVSLEGIGIVFARITKKGVKLTTNVVQLFGKYFKKNVFDIDEGMKEQYIRGMDLKKSLPTASGYVVLRWKEHYLGVGLYNEHTQTIKNMIPKARRIKKL